MAVGRARYFYPRSPCGERRIHYDNYNLHCVISIHALLAESDTPVIVRIHKTTSYFYPRSPCGERHNIPPDSVLIIDISIHALLAESDPQPNGGGQTTKKFLSTLSLRRATFFRSGGWGRSPNFYPRSPCGERQNDLETIRKSSQPISIHALLAESDKCCFVILPAALLFLSTLSLRRATLLGLLGWLRTLISIHALLAESDGGSGVGSWRLVIFLSTLSLRRATGRITSNGTKKLNFYPRSPCGERHGQSA